MILVYIETDSDSVKKSSLEAVAFASSLAKKLSVDSVAITASTLGTDKLEMVGNYGAKKVLQYKGEGLVAQNLASMVAKAAEKVGASVVILPKSVSVDGFASRLSIKLKANLVSNVTELPDTSSGFKVKRSIYTGKAFAWVEIKSSKKVLVIKKNAINPQIVAEKATVEAFSESFENKSSVTIKETIKATGDILLTDAEIVVSGGRGMKGPENWHLIENLAKALGAATGCSKPVSDMDWRPHHEHVGQTGVKVSPNIYFAVGISGAIQHLAGVNSSKVIVAINKDPEAPFFKAADYGIVGDAFEILPKLTEAAKKLN
jgi:electron transfer flavoprotein alpha subunit